MKQDSGHKVSRLSVTDRRVKREVVIKYDEDTDPAYGVRPEERGIKEYMRHGVVNLDKPSGPTSHEVVAWVKRMLKLDHGGHGGTLDPRVTGVLPVMIEEATKISRAFLYSGKEYVCVMRLHSSAPSGRVRSVLNEFVGEIYQRPPLRSSVSRRLRKRTIYYIEDLEFVDNRVLFRVGCQAGTYIRKLCHDIGEALGLGAHMEELRRTKVGPLTEDRISTLYDLYEAHHMWSEDGDESLLRRVIQPMEKCLEHVPKIFLRDSAVDSICHGANLAAPGIAKVEKGMNRNNLTGLYTLKGELIALAKALMNSNEMLSKEKGIATETKRVIMTPNTYPRFWRKHR